MTQRSKDCPAAANQQTREANPGMATPLLWNATGSLRSGPGECCFDRVPAVSKTLPPLRRSGASCDPPPTAAFTKIRQPRATAPRRLTLPLRNDSGSQRAAAARRPPGFCSRSVAGMSPEMPPAAASRESDCARRRFCLWAIGAVGATPESACCTCKTLGSELIIAALDPRPVRSKRLPR